MNTINLAGVVILNDERKILLLYRPKKDQWELPGGKVDNGESYLETAVREIKEELGCNIIISPVEPIGGAKFKEDDYEMYYVWFKGELKEEVPRIMEEAFTDLRYFSIFNLPENISPNMKNLSKQILNNKVKIE